MENFTNATQSPVAEAVCFVHDSLAVKIFRILPYCVIIPVSLIGNSMVVAIVLRDRNMYKTVNFFIVNMSIADLIATIVYMPRVISIWLEGYEWQLDGLAGYIFCKISVCFNQTSIAVSIFTVVVISLDRFFAVVFPLRRFITSKIAQIIIVVIWIASLFTAFPQFYGIKIVKRGGKPYCYLELDKVFGEGSSTAYYMFTMFGLFAVPLVTIVVLYSAIMVALLKRRRLVGDATASDNERLQRQERTRKKVLKMVSLVVVAFVLCWLLYFICFILYSYKVKVPCNVFYLRMPLAHMNSAINPVIYWSCNENFRRGYLKIFRSLLPCVTGAARISPLEMLNKQTRDTCSNTRQDGNLQSAEASGNQH